MQSLSLFQTEAVNHSVITGASQLNDKQLKEKSRITRWVIGENNQALGDYLKLLLPILSWQSHHNNQRWITWIASQFIEKDQLKEFGVNLNHLRMIVESQSKYSSFKLLLTALKNNRSAMVVASLPELDSNQKEELEFAASQGNCEAIILTHY